VADPAALLPSGTAVVLRMETVALRRTDRLRLADQVALVDRDAGRQEVKEQAIEHRRQQRCPDANASSCYNAAKSGSRRVAASRQHPGQSRIETMQLTVVAAILPSLIILSRTSAYTAFRLAGALFAGFASLGWIVQRLFGVDYSVDLIVDRVAQPGPWIAISLLVISITEWLRSEPRPSRDLITRCV
jgi:hypothetical protein